MNVHLGLYGYIQQQHQFVKGLNNNESWNQLKLLFHEVLIELQTIILQEI